MIPNFLEFNLILVLTDPIVKWGEIVSSFIMTLGDFTLFVWETLVAMTRLWRRRDLLIKQCEFIGVQSLSVTMVAAVFMGSVLGYQLYVSFHLFNAEALLGGSVGVGLFRELAPVMGAIMVTGRAGAAMAAEIASMRVSEQIDALEVMGIDPIEYLVVPRVVAGFIMMPILAFFFAVMGSAAAGVISCGMMGLDWTIFWHQYTKVTDKIDLIHCVTKGAAFGVILTWIGCYCGYQAHGGARAVGAATRSTVVASCLSILLGDYLLTSLLPFGFSRLRI